MKSHPIEFSIKNDLERCLHDLRGRAVELIEKQHHWTLASLNIPIWVSKPRRSVNDDGKTHQVTLSLLRETLVNGVKRKPSGKKSHDLGLSNPGFTMDENRMIGGKTASGTYESFDVHVFFSPVVPPLLTC
jgi:hypothetical protein